MFELVAIAIFELLVLWFVIVNAWRHIFLIVIIGTISYLVFSSFGSDELNTFQYIVGIIYSFFPIFLIFAVIDFFSWYKKRKAIKNLSPVDAKYEEVKPREAGSASGGK